MSEGTPLDSMAGEPQDPRDVICERIEALSARLGFVESSEMKELRMTCAAEGGSVAREPFVAWQIQAEVLVDAVEDKHLCRSAQVGKHLCLARLYLDAGMSNEYNDAINDALLCASNFGLQDVVEELKTV